MKTELEALTQTIAFKKRQALKIKRDYLAIIYKGLLQSKSIKQIHKELFEATINGDKMLYKYATILSNKCFKRAISSPKGETADILISILSLALVKNNFNKIINKNLRVFEETQKEKIVKTYINDSLEREKVFFQCSQHLDCAKDHVEAQGKLYITKNWKNYIKSEEVKEKISQFVKNNNIKTLEYIMGSPVYLITRPHCRHYFVARSVNDVILRHISPPTRKIGNRVLATPYKDELQDRLADLRALRRIKTTPILETKIRKYEMIDNYYS